MSEHRRQEPPYTIKLELVEGCNLRCSFCAMNGIREPKINDYKFLTVERADAILSQIKALGWRSRFELAMRGEPTMNPDAAAIIGRIRHHLPKTHIMMTSNGGGLLSKPGPVSRIRQMFDAGLNVLALDDYRGANIVPKIREALTKNEELRPDSVSMTLADAHNGFVSFDDIHSFECPRDADGNPYRRHPVSYKMITFIEELEDTAAKGGNGIRSHISNQCGVAGPLNDSMKGRRCARPFRELAINYDGKVSLCCNNWRGTYKLGDCSVPGGVEAVWQGDAVNAARRKLYHGERDFGPCAGCDSHSFRVGLLPDPVGKFDLPRADEDDVTAIAKALSGLQYTPSVKRPWEK